jgi:IclR family transcriptional regulator, acetate operon repressor
MSATAPRGTLGTVHNAALLLQLLGTGPLRHQITDLAEQSGMSLATLHRLLRSLVAAGLVEQDPASSRYGLGPQFLLLAEQYRSRLPLLQSASPFLVELRDRTSATARLHVLVGDEAVEIDRIDGEDVGGVFRDANRADKALRSAAGRVLLAHAPGEVWERALATTPLPQDTDPVEARRCWRESSHVVLAATSAADRPEAATAVRGARGTVVGALSVAGPASRLTPELIEEQLVPHLLQAASAVSRALGHA